MSTKKTIIKFFLYLPFGIMLGMLGILFLEGTSPFYWQIGLLIGVVITTYFIIINVNEYNSFDDISSEDYLESRHVYKFRYDPVIWDEFNTLLEKQFTNHKIYKNRPSEVVVKVENSIVKMKHHNDELMLSVERNSFDFIPDRANNYQMLRRIVSALKESNNHNIN